MYSDKFDHGILQKNNFYVFDVIHFIRGKFADKRFTETVK